MYPTQFEIAQDGFYSSTAIITACNDVTNNLWQFLKPYGSWQSDQAKCNEIQRRLSYFCSTHSCHPDDIDDVIQALSRGLYLTLSAMEWQEPTAGCSPTDKPNATHRARGVQWRLVMAYGGFETTIKTLINHKKYLNPEIITNYINKCDLQDYRLLTSPNPQRDNLEKWLGKPSQQGKTALANFLGLSAGDQKIIEAYIVESTPISDWIEAVKLAKALRNATAHGALSATKVKKWGLENSFLTVSDNLVEIVVAGLQKLI